MEQYKILDCTLRDGGYYTNWNFDIDTVKSLVKALDSVGVDIIELGYKSPKQGGPYRKCNDGFISSIIDFNVNADLAFMIDVKDYINNNKIDESLLTDIVKPASIFKICRIAAKSDEIHYIPQLTKILKSLGYEVICNLMAVSICKSDLIQEYVNITNKLNLMATYIADSYGALYPIDVATLFKKYKLSGIHTHDNMGLAFANCLSAISNGATYIDGTLTGMGRGVGNVTTEQLLINKGEINSKLISVVKTFTKMKQHYGWGTNAIYHMAGKHHIHPLYMQDLNQSNLEPNQLINVVDSLKGELTYQNSILKNLKKQRAVIVIPARYSSSRFPGKPLAKINGKEMILHVADRCKAAIGSENVYIATENKLISNIVKKAGYNVIITSDSCLTGTDRVAEAAKEIDADIFINVQGDEPMIDPDDILNAIEVKKQYPDHIINCMSALHKDEDCNNKKIPKVVCDEQFNLLYCSRNAIPTKKNESGNNIMKQVCIYVFNKEQLNRFHDTNKMPLEEQEDIEIVRCLEKGMSVKMLKVDKVSYAVDYPEDINTIENML